MSKKSLRIIIIVFGLSLICLGLYPILSDPDLRMGFLFVFEIIFKMITVSKIITVLIIGVIILKILIWIYKRTK